MASRQDQLQSYQFLLQRVVSALVYRKTDPAQSPFRKAGGAVFAGVMISILALAVTAAIGLFANIGKKTNWWEGGVVIMEEETGAAYVVFPPKDKADADNPAVLYPVANFASAALLAGTTETISVNQRSLTGEGVDTKVPPRGMTVGIPGAPLSLPSADNLITKPNWTVCSDQRVDEPESKLYVGEKLGGGTGMGNDEALLITEEDEIYLVGSNGYKHRVAEPEAALGALGLGNAPRPTVAPALTKALPTGEELAVPELGSGVGESSNFGGAKVGDVFENTASANVEYYVAMPDGSAPISELQAILIRNSTKQEGFKTGSQASEAASNINEDYRYRFLADKQDAAASAAALPEKVPAVPGGWDAGAVCAAFSGATPTVQFNTPLPINPGIATSGISEDTGGTFADRIVVPPGQGMLVSTGSATEGAISLITSEGRSYPIAQPSDSDNLRYKIVAPAPAKEALGYSEVKPVSISSTVLSLIPAGVELNPQTAIESAVGKREVSE